MINQRDNICKTCNDEIVVEDLICTIFFTTKAAFFSRDVDFDNSLFATVFWVKFALFSFEIDRLFRYSLKISNDILFFFFFLEISFWCFCSVSTNKMTHNKSSISLTWRQSKAKSIVKDLNQSEFSFELTQDLIDFARDASFFSFSSTTRLFLFWDEKFESHVAQELVTSSSMIINFSRNFLSLWTISHFFEFREADDLSNEITKLDSETKKTRANRSSIDELMKMQTKEQEIKTFFLSISNSFFLIRENDTDDWFSLARFSKIEEKIEEATDSNTNSKEKIKIESQSSQSKWTFSNTNNSAKRQTTHTNSSFKLFSQTNFKSSSHSSSFRNGNESKNSTEQTNKQSKFSRWST